ncbi:excinuclease ABC subunit C [Microbacterium kyungheense]|nr:excinuclease ABC subunit C [Microbacterium kyungheense]
MSSAAVLATVQIPSSANAPIVADFTEHAIRVAYVAREEILRLAEAEWSSPGIYVLLVDDGSRQIYVGQSTKLRDRLAVHRRSNAQVPAWTRAVLIKRDTSHGFSSADIGYLEGRLAAELDAIPGLTVVKGKVDEDTTLSAPAMMPLDAIMPSIFAAIRLTGLRMDRLDDVPAQSAPTTTFTRTAIPGTVADLLAEGLLQAGSELYCTRHGLEGRGTIAPDGNILVNGAGYSNPSRAAAAAFDGTSSGGFGGWEMWRVGSLSGPSLSSLRAQLPTRSED